MSDINLNIDNNGIHRPWLSVVMPIYNAEKFLNKCLDSIAGQTYKDFEVVLIDDGSTDSSSVICQKYADSDSRFRYIKKENGGAYQSRIYGAERAQGTYITFCDADDYYASKDAFEILHREITSSECSVIQFGYMKKYNHLSRKGVAVSQTMDIDRDLFLNQEYPKLLCSFWDASHLTTNLWNKVYHRRLLSNIPSSDVAERVFWGEDLILNLHLLKDCNSFKLIPDILYCYCQLNGGTSKFSTRTMKDLDCIKRYQLQFLEQYQGSAKKSIEKILYSEVAGWFFYYIQQATEHLSEDELADLINETLQYKNFILARNYYLEKAEDNYDAVNLLRKGDAQEYIKKAKEYHKKQKLKASVKNILKKIYASI